MPYAQDAAEQAFAARARAAIRATYQTLAEAMSQGDAGRIARCYTPDAMLFSADARPVQGRGAIERAFARTIGSGVIFRRVPIDVERHGDVAYEYGKLTVRSTNGDVRAAVVYMVLWKKTRDGWKMHRDFISGTRP